MSRQWRRAGMDGARYAFDHALAMVLMRERGWHVERGFALMLLIEDAVLSGDASERQPGPD